MSQSSDWNTAGNGQAYPPQYEQGNPQAMVASAPGYGMPGMEMPVPPGMYQDQNSGLILPNGTALAPVGRRIGACLLGVLLTIVTLEIGYLIWGAITCSNGQTPVQKMLGLQTWKPLERVNAPRGTMFLRGLIWFLAGVIPLGHLVSFILFLAGKQHRTLHDLVSSTVILHDPNKVLQPTR
jgi:uncharacterized RDD family membrane protein YckC